GVERPGYDDGAGTHLNVFQRVREVGIEVQERIDVLERPALHHRNRGRYRQHELVDGGSQRCEHAAPVLVVADPDQGVDRTRERRIGGENRGGHDVHAVGVVGDVKDPLAPHFKATGDVSVGKTGR